MISLINHGIGSSELLYRRFTAVRGCVDSTIVGKLNLNTTSNIHESGTDVFASDSRHSSVRILTAGVVGEARILADGRRQILSLRFPGDALAHADGETFVALTRVKTAEGVALLACLSDGSDAYQPLRRAWVAALRTDQAILRDQVVRLGRMSAFERMAHMLLEVHERLAQVGLATETTFHMPLTQEMISDVIGLSVVHLNRTLQSLRRSDLVVSKQGYVTLVDRPRLVEVAGYVSRFPRAWSPGQAQRAARVMPPPMALAS